MRLIYSQKGIQLTESFEADSGPILIAFADPLSTPPGVSTAGWGHTGKDVIVGTTYTYQQCVMWLQSDYHWAENVVNSTVTFDLTQNEFDGCVDLVYNIGAEAWGKSTLLALLNKGETQAAALEFDKWDHAGGKVVAGLLRRRQAETNLFEATT